MKVTNALLLVVTLTSTTFAQLQIDATPQFQVQPPVVRPNVRVVPPVRPPVQQNPYYFGMELQVINDHRGTILRVASVTPGGPACQAGLEAGDIIYTANGNRFSYTSNSYAAVRQLNGYVQMAGIPVAAAPAAPAYATAVAPRVSPQLRPVAHMQVINVRTGGLVPVTVHPSQRYYANPGAPAVAAPPVPAAASPVPSPSIPTNTFPVR